MSIGNGPDYYNGINKEREKEAKLAGEIEEWWGYLEDNDKYEFLEPYYPDKLRLMGMNEAWEGLKWEDQLDIYNEDRRMSD